jgi:hypothetical protein
MAGWCIRDAELKDAPELAVLMCELGYETGRTEMGAHLKLILTNPAFKTFVAIMHGSVCGMVATLTYPSYEHNDSSGRILGIRRVSLDTRPTREDAHKFYESLGYERNGWRFVKQLSVSN